MIEAAASSMASVGRSGGVKIGVVTKLIQIEERGGAE
jgi:hypothetical protein